MIDINIDYVNKLKGYNFVDLFCGIGGFHLALKSFGANCVFASDIDNEARKVYKENFEIEPDSDIRFINELNIPSHDILCAGFPCQAFSISGAQAGFKDKKTGDLFFEIIRVAKHHKPKVILLENVANIETHDSGKTIERIISELKLIKYKPFKKVLCASDYNVPQYRKRLYIIAFRDDLNITNFEFPEKITLVKNLDSILERDSKITSAYKINREYKLREKYKSIEKQCNKPYIRIGEIGLGRQGERIYSTKGCSTTLSATSGGLGGRTGIYLIKKGLIRKLTPRECARLMGFPEDFNIAHTANQAYQQFGNSVVVDVIQRIIVQAIESLYGGK